MESNLECPICEERFTVDENPSSKKVKCPGCSRSFKLSSEQIVSSPAATTKPAASAPLPKQFPPAQSDSATNKEPGSEKNLTGVNPSKASSLEMAVAKQKRKKSKMIRGIATIVGLATIVGILAGLLVMRLSDQAKQKNTPPETASKESAVETEPKLQAGSDLETATSLGQTQREEPKPEKRIQHEELEPQKFFFHESAEVNECWDLIYPHLVNLTVHDGRGTHKAIGTIVDSRGWILTSYSAIKGASKIEVTPGYKTIDQYYLPPTLSDSVRGIITSDPAQDLVVLSINRRFIVSFADLIITDKNFVVEGEFMLQCGPPTPEGVYSAYESKIAISGKFDELAPASKSVAESKQLTSDELSWLVCPDQQKGLPGAPLVRIDGTLEAIQVFSDNDLAHYVPVHQLKPLLADAIDKPQPLSALQESSTAAVGSSKFGVGVTHPTRESSVQLNRLAEDCEQFNWIANDEKKYAQLKKFSQHFATVLKYIKDNRASEPELVEPLETQIKQIKNLISAGLIKAEPTAIKSMNQLAAKDLKKTNQIVPFYGEVIELEVAVRNDVLQLVGTEPSSNVSLQPDQSRDLFFRGDVCLAFIEVPAEIQQRAFKIQGKTVVSVIVDLITRVEAAK